MDLSNKIQNGFVNMSLFISYHLETDVKEHMGIETFWVNLGGFCCFPLPSNECIGKEQAVSFSQMVCLEIELNLVKLVALSPYLAPGVLLLAIFSPPLLSFSVDLVTLTTALEIFNEHDLQASEHVMDVVEVIHCLTALYERLEEERGILVNVPLCVDMSLNWLLNVFDR